MKGHFDSTGYSNAISYQLFSLVPSGDRSRISRKWRSWRETLESLPLSDGEATKTLGGSGAFCFITWK